MFSIIVPVLNEQEQINALVEHIRARGFEGTYEIIVVDGDPHGGTIQAVRDESVTCIAGSRGRGRQMNAGARASRGDVLLFLHADTRLPPDALKSAQRVLENQKYVAGAFDLSIDSKRWILKYIAARANTRSRLNRIPYGDQAIFIRKDYFDRIGGFKDIPLMEDVDLMRRIRKNGKQIHILASKVTTSARRWEKEGAVYTTLKNQVIVMLYYLGVGPERLARLYRCGGNGQNSQQESVKRENE
jgi:rSAM/selenodomain-associated transferase 2